MWLRYGRCRRYKSQGDAMYVSRRDQVVVASLLWRVLERKKEEGIVVAWIDGD